jgi:hypothetical protein
MPTLIRPVAPPGVGRVLREHHIGGRAPGLACEGAGGRGSLFPHFTLVESPKQDLCAGVCARAPCRPAILEGVAAVFAGKRADMGPAGWLGVHCGNAAARKGKHGGRLTVITDDMHRVAPPRERRISPGHPRRPDHPPPANSEAATPAWPASTGAHRARETPFPRRLRPAPAGHLTRLNGRVIGWSAISARFSANTTATPTTRTTSWDRSARTTRKPRTSW